MVDGRKVTRWLYLNALMALVALAAPSVSNASFEIVPGSLQVSTLDGEGNPDTQAGSHPDRLTLNYELNVVGTAIRDLTFEFGAGLSGSPFATPACPRAVFEDGEGCPADTQVGVFTLKAVEGQTVQQPLYNIVPTANEIANFAFEPFWQTELGMTLRPTDFGLTMSTTDMPDVPSVSGQVELWGVPADHNGGLERAPFLTMPTECTPLAIVMRARSWEDGAQMVSETAETTPFTGCQDLPFEPHLRMDVSNRDTDSPTGTQINLEMNQHSGPDEQMSAYLKEVSIDLPSGMTFSAGAVEGTDVCTDAQFGLGTASTVRCPLRSRAGAVEFATPQLNETITGTIFLGEEKPGERFRLFVHATAPGVNFKSVVKLIANPKTGDITAVIDNLPQVALSRISLNVGSSSALLLANPLTCGSYPAHARFIAYGPHVPVDSFATVTVDNSGAPCPNPPAFSPGVVGGSTGAQAGAYTGLSLTLQRRSGEQLIKKFAATLPSGVNANLTHVHLCSEAVATAGLCGPDSRIGSVVGEVGSGPTTAIVGGSVYLTEHYRDAPFGISIVFDTSVGPFQFGALNLRGMLRLDPQSDQHKLETDPLPLLFEGVDLRFQKIGIDLDRPNFLRNPTSCEAKKIIASVTSVDDREATVEDPFYVTGCEGLDFNPHFSLALTDRGSSSALSVGLRGHDGDANVRQFKVKFPSLLAFHSHGVGAVCARKDATEGLCPGAARVGSTIVHTPLLTDPLRGPVYLVQPKGGGFPDLWSQIEGNGVTMQLTGESSREDGRLVTEMVNLPDVPLSTFQMTLNGGRHALFSVKGNPCGPNGLGKAPTPITVQAENAAYRQTGVRFKTSCAGHGRKGRMAGRRVPHRQG
jgi:hypothetical protein